METVARYVAAIVIAYLLGAIPVGLVLVTLVKGVDVRRYGSGKTGATNVLRTLGWWAGAFVLVADVAKASGAVLIAGALTRNQMAQAGAGIVAILGHNWPVYVGFRGGRGVSTSLGGALPLSLLAGIPAFATFLLVVAITRYVSLGSILGPLVALIISATLVAMGREPAALLVYIAVAVALIIVQHRDNIVRLAHGTERKVGQKAAETPPAPAEKTDNA